MESNIACFIHSVFVLFYFISGISLFVVFSIYIIYVFFILIYVFIYSLIYLFILTLQLPKGIQVYHKGVLFLFATSHTQTRDCPALCSRNNSLLKSLEQDIATFVCFWNNICFQICLGVHLHAFGKQPKCFYGEIMYQISGDVGDLMSGKCHISLLQSACSYFSFLKLLFPLQNNFYKGTRNHCVLACGICARKIVLIVLLFARSAKKQDKNIILVFFEISIFISK